MKFFLAFFVVLAMLAMMTTASPLPLASGGQINLPNEHCVCICQRGGYMGWLAEKIDSLAQMYFEKNVPTRDFLSEVA